MMRDLLLPLLLALFLTGCVEVEERLALDMAGGGQYELKLVWDADLLLRVHDVVGTRVASRFARGALPLDAAAWRESLQGVPGLRVELVEVEDLQGGRRVLRVRVAFDRLENLLGWEIFARRGLDVSVREGNEKARLRMAPLLWVPSLSRVVDALALWRASPSRSATGGLKEPSLAERLGVMQADGDLLADLLEARLAEARFTFRVEVPATEPGAWEFDVQAIGRRGGGGAIDLEWSPRAFDRVQPVSHPKR